MSFTVSIPLDYDCSTGWDIPSSDGSSYRDEISSKIEELKNDPRLNWLSPNQKDKYIKGLDAKRDAILAQLVKLRDSGGALDTVGQECTHYRQMLQDAHEAFIHDSRALTQRRGQVDSDFGHVYREVSAAATHPFAPEMNWGAVATGAGLGGGGGACYSSWRASSAAETARKAASAETRAVFHLAGALEEHARALKCEYGDAIQRASGYLGQLNHQEKALKQAGASLAEIAEATAEPRAAYNRAMETVRELGIKAKMAADEAVGYARTHLGDAPAEGIARGISGQKRKVPLAMRYLITPLDEAIERVASAGESATVKGYLARTTAAEAVEQVGGKTLAKRIVAGAFVGAATSVVVQAAAMLLLCPDEVQ